MVEHGGNLLHRHARSPIGKLHDRPDAFGFVRFALDFEQLAELLDLPRDPPGIVGMSKAGVVGHDDFACDFRSIASLCRIAPSNSSDDHGQ